VCVNLLPFTENKVLVSEIKRLKQMLEQENFQNRSIVEPTDKELRAFNKLCEFSSDAVKVEMTGRLYGWACDRFPELLELDLKEGVDYELVPYSYRWGSGHYESYNCSFDFFTSKFQTKVKYGLLADDLHNFYSNVKEGFESGVSEVFEKDEVKGLIPDYCFARRMAIDSDDKVVAKNWKEYRECLKNELKRIILADGFLAKVTKEIETNKTNIYEKYSKGEYTDAP